MVSLLTTWHLPRAYRHCALLAAQQTPQLRSVQRCVEFTHTWMEPVAPTRSAAQPTLTSCTPSRNVQPVYFLPFTSRPAGDSRIVNPWVVGEIDNDGVPAADAGMSNNDIDTGQGID
ncbi:MAG: hypothetical protein ABI284_07085 [Nitrosospira sp.]